MFFRDCSSLSSQPVDKQEGLLISTNIQHCQTIPTIGTLARAMRKPICMLPMLDSVHSRDRAFKMLSIMFCVFRLILAYNCKQNHNTLWLEGKIKSISIIFLSFNEIVLSCNILAYCCMRRCLEWGAHGDNGDRHSWQMCGLASFYLSTMHIRCPPSNKSCQRGVFEFPLKIFFDFMDKTNNCQKVHLNIANLSPKRDFRPKPSLEEKTTNII